eukprot:11050928-Alexandrium_andersonii.AAC.1
MSKRHLPPRRPSPSPQRLSSESPPMSSLVHIILLVTICFQRRSSPRRSPSRWAAHRSAAPRCHDP